MKISDLKTYVVENPPPSHGGPLEAAANITPARCSPQWLRIRCKDGIGR